MVNNEELTKEQQIKAKEFLFTEEDLFALSIENMRRMNVTTHNINTEDAVLIKQTYYRAVYKENEFIRKEINKLKEQGLIIEINSPWVSPVVIVPKKNGKLHFCIDYWKLNIVMKKDTYPLPLINDLLDTFRSAKWFSTLDLISGYWQIGVSEEDIEKMTFITKYDKVLGDCVGNFAVVYLDDINIYSNSFEEHLKHLKIVISKLKNAKLKLNPEKYIFFKSKINYLGHVINKEG
ncbi:2368_t:CDS:2, partial [Dentiscutata erythropus]